MNKSSFFPLPSSIPWCPELMGVRRLQINENQSWESARSWITLQNSPSILPQKAGAFIFPVAAPKFPCSTSCLPTYPWNLGHRGFATALGRMGRDMDTKIASNPFSLGVFSMTKEFLFSLPSHCALPARELFPELLHGTNNQQFPWISLCFSRCSDVVLLQENGNTWC